jgi:hypothetical protein
MVELNRETMLIAAVAVCLLTCFYLYNESQKFKTEFSTLSMKVDSQQSKALADDEKMKNDDEKDE